MTDWFSLAKWICVPDRRIEKDDEILRGLRIAQDGHGCPCRTYRKETMSARTKFVCQKCNHSEPTEDEHGKPREWQFCCGEAMQMGAVMGRIVPRQTEKDPAVPVERKL